MTGDLQFDAASHTFTWRGQDVPGVSRILRDMGLSTTWYKDDPKYLERGAAVHQACDFIDDQTYDENGTHPEIVSYVRGYQKFVSDTGFHAHLGGETPIYSASLRAAGIPDKWGGMKQHGVHSGIDLWLLDLKTGEQKPPGVELQLGMYRLMLADGININGEKVSLKFTSVKCLLLQKSGDYKLIDCSDPKWVKYASDTASLWQLRKSWGLLPKNGRNSI